MTPPRSRPKLPTRHRPRAKARPLLSKSKAVGTVQLATEFLAAARNARQGAPEPSRVATFLYCHGVELLLKGALICAGIDEVTLRDLGHDLSATLRAVRHHPAAIQPKLTRTDYYVPGCLNTMYSAKDFEYLFTGFRRYPNLDPVEDLSTRMVAYLKPAIEMAVRSSLRRGNPGSG